MSEKEFEPLGKTILVHVDLPQAKNQEDLEELHRLAESAGSEICDSIVCRRDVIEPRTYVGSGKVVEIADAVRAHDAKVVIFNSPLTPAQERNLEKEIGVRVMDRIALILVIFDMRARTYEGKLQVELAHLRYEQARLVRGWTHLERQKGGFGLRGGPGETQIELDRRALRERIAAIKEDLEVVAKRREQNRAQRKKNAIPVVSFVGYTNAGKSTLFNRLTNSEVYAADQLFATLDPTLRNMSLPTIGKAVFADTVGFIRHLPHELVAAFRATLEETVQSDLLLHIIDIADPRIEENMEAVNAVLEQIDAHKIPTLLVFNKTDLKEDVAVGIVRDSENVPVRVNVSAKTGAGLDDLINAVSELLALDQCEFKVKITHNDGKLRSLLYDLNSVYESEFNEMGEEILRVKLKPNDCNRLDKQTAGRLVYCLVDEDNNLIPWDLPKDFDPVKVLKELITDRACEFKAKLINGDKLTDALQCMESVFDVQYEDSGEKAVAEIKLRDIDAARLEYLSQGKLHTVISSDSAANAAAASADADAGAAPDSATTGDAVDASLWPWHAHSSVAVMEKLASVFAFDAEALFIKEEDLDEELSALLDDVGAKRELTKKGEGSLVKLLISPADAAIVDNLSSNKLSQAVYNVLYNMNPWEKTDYTNGLIESLASELKDEIADKMCEIELKLSSDSASEMESIIEEFVPPNRREVYEDIYGDRTLKFRLLASEAKNLNEMCDNQLAECILRSHKKRIPWVATDDFDFGEIA